MTAEELIKCLKTFPAHTPVKVMCSEYAGDIEYFEHENAWPGQTQGGLADKGKPVCVLWTNF